LLTLVHQLLLLMVTTVFNWVVAVAFMCVTLK
jgi:hypothetical protein